MKKTFYAFILFFAFLTAALPGFAQQDPQFSQYMFNHLFLHPGYAGMDDGGHFSFIHRSQWVGYTGADGGNPETQLLTFNAPLYRLNSGVGVQVMNDRVGALNNLEAQVSFAHHLQVGKGKLSLGVRGGIYSMGFDRSLLRPNQENDRVILTGGETTLRPDLGAGAWYRAEKFFVGASANHLLRPTFDFGGGDSAATVLENHFYLTGGYHFDVTYSLRVTPSFLVKSVAFDRYSYEISTIATYNERFWGGLSYRQEDAVIAMIGLGLDKNNRFRFGYALDLTVANRDAKQFTSHEFLLSYSFPIAVVGSKPQIRTPRFRH